MGPLEPADGPNSRIDLETLMREADLADRSQQFGKAEEICAQILSIDPSFLPAKLLAAVLFLKTGRVNLAETGFKEILRAEPRSFPALLWLGTIYSRQGRTQEAVPLARRASSLKPDDRDARHLLAMTLFESHRLPESVTEFNAVLALDEKMPDVHSLLGAILQQLGDAEGSDAHLLRAMELAPGLGPPYYDYVQGRKITLVDKPLISRMEQVLSDPSVSSRDRSRIHFALGKSYNDLGEFEVAMRHFDVANEIALKGMEAAGRAFNRQQSKENFARSAEISDRWPRSSPGSKSELPVLVVGMMRSGTTLIEHVLSRHSQIGAAGEQGFWLDNVGGFQSNRRTPTIKEAQELANAYLELLGSFGEGKTRVTDKMPHNFLALGTVHAVFPNARIIHCRRNLVDSCLSIYMTPFRISPEFGHSKENIVYFAREYERLMQHWRKVFPPDRFIEVEYEKLVSDPETEIKKIVGFLGLEWEEACLDQTVSKRAVSTPSVWQVRQPIHKGSVDRWRNYEPWLGPFAQFLQGGKTRP